MLVLYQPPRQAIVRIERDSPAVLSPVAGHPGTWRNDTYVGGPFVLRQTARGADLLEPGWPATTCRP